MKFVKAEKSENKQRVMTRYFPGFKKIIALDIIYEKICLYYPAGFGVPFLGEEAYLS